MGMTNAPNSIEGPAGGTCSATVDVSARSCRPLQAAQQHIFSTTLRIIAVPLSNALRRQKLSYLADMIHHARLREALLAGFDV
jgi:hypothetical protein